MHNNEETSLEDRRTEAYGFGYAIGEAIRFLAPTVIAMIMVLLLAIGTAAGIFLYYHR